MGPSRLVQVCTCQLRIEHGQVAFVVCPGFVVRSRRVCLGRVGHGAALARRGLGELPGRGESALAQPKIRNVFSGPDR